MEDSDLLRKWKEKSETLRTEGFELYPAPLSVKDTSAALSERYGSLDGEALSGLSDKITLAGRIMAIRNFGKAAFISLQDRKGRIQAYIGKDALGEKTFHLFKRLDVGDIVWVEGHLLRTKTGELTVGAEKLSLLSKAQRPLPEKWHGLTDIESRYRQRHLDLVMNPRVLDVFRKRSRIIQRIRRFMEERDFLEVETPMMQPIAGGALAKPFKTFHNALSMDLYLRIAPELYLKRLITGGLERIYEINRNFRNEGLSSFHNPEFTMMEFYQAYATYEDLMPFTEELFADLARDLFGSLRFRYQGQDIDLTPPWQRLSVEEAIRRYSNCPEILTHPALAKEHARHLGLECNDSDSLGEIILAVFEEEVEHQLIQPHFITHYPVEASPLAKRTAGREQWTDRFELYLCGREIANAFSELNDPAEQRERFQAQRQKRDGGNEEAHAVDDDYIRVLECAMPPTAGEGIGIDRLIMILTDSPSIRDVILFPLMRPKES